MGKGKEFALLLFPPENLGRPSVDTRIAKAMADYQDRCLVQWATPLNIPAGKGGFTFLGTRLVKLATFILAVAYALSPLDQVRKEYGSRYKIVRDMVSQNRLNTAIRCVRAMHYQLFKYQTGSPILDPRVNPEACKRLSGFEITLRYSA